MKTANYQILPGLFLFSLLGAGFKKAGANASTESGQTASASDSLKYLEHATVKIKTSEGKIIYIDPSSQVIMPIPPMSF